MCFKIKLLTHEGMNLCCEALTLGSVQKRELLRAVKDILNDTDTEEQPKSGHLESALQSWNNSVWEVNTEIEKLQKHFLCKGFSILSPLFTFYFPQDTRFLGIKSPMKTQPCRLLISLSS